MDETIQNLARLAATGNLDAAKRLVRYLERSGIEDQEQLLQEQMLRVLGQDRRANYSGDEGDTIELAEMGAELARILLNYLAGTEELAVSTDAFGIRRIDMLGRTITFSNAGEYTEQ